MFVILSPAKTLDFESEIPKVEATEIRFPMESQTLASVLKTKSAVELTRLMNISNQLAVLNAERYFQWRWPFKKEDTRSALFAFKGDVYSGLDAFSMEMDTIRYTQTHVRILSGLYGLLRPLDAIMPYRLEMGTRLTTSKGDDLYRFWGNEITRLLNEDMMQCGQTILVNLASQEYFKSLDLKFLDVEVVTPVFKDFKNGEYKIISFFAKKARGMMTRFIVENRLSSPDDLKAFDMDGYHFNNEMSNNNQFVFTRR